MHVKRPEVFSFKLLECLYCLTPLLRPALRRNQIMNPPPSGLLPRQYSAPAD